MRKGKSTYLTLTSLFIMAQNTEAMHKTAPEELSFAEKPARGSSTLPGIGEAMTLEEIRLTAVPLSGMSSHVETNEIHAIIATGNLDEIFALLFRQGLSVFQTLDAFEYALSRDYIPMLKKADIVCLFRGRLKLEYMQARVNEYKYYLSRSLKGVEKELKEYIRKKERNLVMLKNIRKKLFKINGL